MLGIILRPSSLLLMAAVGFTLAVPAFAQDELGKEMQAIAGLQKKYGDALMALPGINGHGIGLRDGKPALHIYSETDAGKTNAENFIKLANKKNGAKEVADALEGQPVVIEVIGKIVPQKQAAASRQGNEENGLASLYLQLFKQRLAHTENLHRYWQSGVFPRNETVPDKQLPIFVDLHGTHCAVGYLMKEVGATDLVRTVAESNNHVYVMDVKRGPVVDWILRSGLTQEECARIQPTYKPRPPYPSEPPIYPLPPYYPPVKPRPVDDVVRLGVLVSPPSEVLREQLGIPEGEGQVIESIYPNSPATKAGLRPRDILLELDDKKVSSNRQAFARLVRSITADTKVDAVVLRRGKRRTIEGITLPGTRVKPPPPPPREVVPFAGPYPARILDRLELTAEQREQLTKVADDLQQDKIGNVQYYMQVHEILNAQQKQKLMDILKIKPTGSRSSFDREEKDRIQKHLAQVEKELKDNTQTSLDQAMKLLLPQLKESRTVGTLGFQVVAPAANSREGGVGQGRPFSIANRSREPFQVRMTFFDEKGNELAGEQVRLSRPDGKSLESQSVRFRQELKSGDKLDLRLDSPNTWVFVEWLATAKVDGAVVIRAD